MKLRKLFESEGIKPVPDAKTTWLRMHRPSVAFLLCIGSGPWRLHRRTLIQTKALEILGNRDLTELRVREVDTMFPLSWQRLYVLAAISYCRLTKKLWKKMKSSSRCGFDQLFEVKDTKDESERAVVHDRVIRLRWLTKGRSIIGQVHNRHCVDLPKVLGMYVRDFIQEDSFPVDRHVRKWLKEHKLPTKQVHLLGLFHAEKLKARYYARALFLDKAKNPVHAPTRKGWKR